MQNHSVSWILMQVDVCKILSDLPGGLHDCWVRTAVLAGSCNEKEFGMQRGNSRARKEVGTAC